MSRYPHFFRHQTIGYAYILYPYRIDASQSPLRSADASHAPAVGQYGSPQPGSQAGLHVGE